MAAAAERVHAAGGLMISDEVQSGLGRSGRWWGYEVSEFTPDIVVMGKPIGAGIPLAATAASRELVESFRRSTRYFNTFASSPVQAAAGNAVLDVFETAGLLDNVRQVGALLVSGIREPNRLTSERGRCALSRPVRRNRMGQIEGNQRSQFCGCEQESESPKRQGISDWQCGCVRECSENQTTFGFFGIECRRIPERSRGSSTHVVNPQAAEADAKCALAAWDIEASSVSLEAISENITFKVVAEDARAYVLRFHRPGYHSLEALNSERVWTRALIDSGLDCPVGVRTSAGKDYAALPICGETP